MRTTAARRALASLALAIGLPLATAGAVAAQSGPSGPSAPPSGPSGPPTTCPEGTVEGPSGPSGPGECVAGSTTEPVVATTRPSVLGGAGLARTGNDAALPLAASAAAITVVLGGRRLASKLHG